MRHRFSRPGRRRGILLPAVAVLLCFSAWAAAALACDCGYDDGQFTINQSLTMDGNMNDWVNILADLDNNSCDGATDSKGVTYEPQPDLDAPVQSTGRDLLHFAYTWDATTVATYTGRAASDANVQRFIYYADTNNNGLMETGEPVVVAQWKGSNRDVKLFLGNYVEATAGGDSLVDGSGYADGYMLPGTAINFPPPGQPDYSGFWGSADGLNMEWQVPWSALGMTPGTAFTFHVSSTNSQPGAASFPDQVDDNMGGCGGGTASTQYAALTFNQNRSLGTKSPGTAYASHTVTNDGNGNDVFNLSSTTGGDFSPTVTYYNDLDGSGTYTAGDTLFTDTDGDGSPDTGTLAPGQTANILIAYTTTVGVQGTSTITTTAASGYDPLVYATNTDTVGITLLAIVADMAASWEGNGVKVTWTTTSEVNVAAFILTRTEEGQPDAVLGNGPIPADGDIAGASYEFLDENALTGHVYTYVLTEMETSGPENLVGELAVDLTAEGAIPQVPVRAQVLAAEAEAAESTPSLPAATGEAGSSSSCFMEAVAF